MQPGTLGCLVTPGPRWMDCAKVGFMGNVCFFLPGAQPTLYQVDLGEGARGWIAEVSYVGASCLHDQQGKPWTPSLA